MYIHAQLNPIPIVPILKRAVRVMTGMNLMTVRREFALFSSPLIRRSSAAAFPTITMELTIPKWKSPSTSQTKI